MMMSNSVLHCFLFSAEFDDKNSLIPAFFGIQDIFIITTSRQVDVLEQCQYEIVLLLLLFCRIWRYEEQIMN